MEQDIESIESDINEIKNKILSSQEFEINCTILEKSAQKNFEIPTQKTLSQLSWATINTNLAKQGLCSMVADNGFAYFVAHQHSKQSAMHEMDKILLCIDRLRLVMGKEKPKKKEVKEDITMTEAIKKVEEVLPKSEEIVYTEIAGNKIPIGTKIPPEEIIPKVEPEIKPDLPEIPEPIKDEKSIEKPKKVKGKFMDFLKGKKKKDVPKENPTMRMP